MFLTVLFLAFSIHAATYQGKNIDGKAYPCSVKTGIEILSASCWFDEKFVTIKASKRMYQDLRLALEQIDDPKEIIVYKGDEAWVLDVELD